MGVLADGLLQAVGNGLAHSTKGNILIGSAGSSGSRSSRDLLDVVLGDLASGAAAL